MWIKGKTIEGAFVTLEPLRAQHAPQPLSVLLSEQ